MRQRSSNPRNYPPPITGLRPAFFREDEWLTYAFGYDPKETDDWIVERNSSDRVSRPLWIGSECRSVFVSGENRRDFVRSFDHNQRFVNFRLAWQDPGNPLLVHEIGSYQVDRRYYDRFAHVNRLHKSLRITCRGNSIFLMFTRDPDFKEEIELGRADQPGRGLQSHKISSILAKKVLGKTINEILVRYLHEDHRVIKISRRRQPDQKNIRVLPRRTPERDYQLSFAWDNFSDDPEIYTKLQGRLGLFQLLA